MVLDREFNNSSIVYEIKSEIVANSPAAVLTSKNNDFFAVAISHPTKENVFVQISVNLDSKTFNRILSTFRFSD
ncbi:hypothetical protein A2865_03475 [Candidatus Woesebacteria bacterium RIFCSPHIGHO2_01_FULL_39_17]|uniref:Uncharacterized protein n=3 Tax=Candidatus Woeseibacteriota TaxID=1752722 RepID=A0A0G0QVG9_9BACT|nr:MAG: hypothetical protein US72_C0007G0012 [Microgenomates group bacterium GW2011_GWC1_38_12]KKQ93787.1 MAG: hypothetical protein UT19_C0007G0031 [Candidatus Woesebacteria bacterium GW2011_GWB1_39_10b]KKR14350.1 MAG: hypothetical protein UT40_C0002G0029 [Candidatus Woesebacteria bacterium GW2011_GWA1_39_21b]OGM23593.1 MAG: hypothetical protein A2865_03475 [Candidatus Woesebacteria bacterium RIFCSPHIGHO2_01_FULL_39_17]OGM64329.1 MAG: hypothetical protein A3A52_05330 [Candidatus Woesebacteria b